MGSWRGSRASLRLPWGVATSSRSLDRPCRWGVPAKKAQRLFSFAVLLVEQRARDHDPKREREYKKRQRNEVWLCFFKKKRSLSLSPARATRLGPPPPTLCQATTACLHGSEKNVKTMADDGDDSGPPTGAGKHRRASHTPAEHTGEQKPSVCLATSMSSRWASRAIFS